MNARPVSSEDVHRDALAEGAERARGRTPRGTNMNANCEWCEQPIEADDETAEGPTTRIGATVTMHAECAEEANAA